MCRHCSAREHDGASAGVVGGGDDECSALDPIRAGAYREIGFGAVRIWTEGQCHLRVDVSAAREHGARAGLTREGVATPRA